MTLLQAREEYRGLICKTFFEIRQYHPESSIDDTVEWVARKLLSALNLRGAEPLDDVPLVSADACIGFTMEVLLEHGLLNLEYKK